MREKVNLRVCRIASQFPPPWRGLSPGIYDLSKAQVAQGVDLEIITKSSGDMEEFDKKSELRIHRIKAKRDICFGLLSLRKVHEIDKLKKINLIHVHGLDLSLAIFLKKYLPIPLVASVHILRKVQLDILKKNGICNVRDAAIFRKAIFLEQLTYKRMDSLLAVSKNIGDGLTFYYKIAKDKINAVYNGVNLKRFDNIQDSKARIENSILYVGALRKRKNVSRIIKALSLISDKLDVHLTIIGQGPEEKNLMALAKDLNLIQKIRFINSIDYDELPKYYRACDLFMLLSFSEGLPKVILEAMASRKPVIASDIPAHRELIQDGQNGFLVDPKNPEQIAEKTALLLTKKELAQQMGNRSRRIIENSFTWEKVAERVNKVYYRIANGQ